MIHRTLIRAAALALAASLIAAPSVRAGNPYPMSDFVRDYLPAGSCPEATEECRAEARARGAEAWERYRKVWIERSGLQGGLTTASIGVAILIMGPVSWMTALAAAVTGGVGYIFGDGIGREAAHGDLGYGYGYGDDKELALQTAGILAESKALLGFQPRDGVLAEEVRMAAARVLEFDASIDASSWEKDNVVEARRAAGLVGEFQNRWVDVLVVLENRRLGTRPPAEVLQRIRPAPQALITKNEVQAASPDFLGFGVMP